ncbi:MAG: tyrosine-type recombinase/integrase [Chloroflexi bacterium]|nr:tyrosine-type recombinase/integrase [Chloroflexota bacterium]
MSTTAIARRKARRMYPRQRGVQHISERKRCIPPEYLEAIGVQALLRCAPHAQAALVMPLQWRGGLRGSEALALEVADISLDGERPTLRVRHGKGNKSRLVPVPPELRAALHTAVAYGGRKGRLVEATRSTAWRWVQEAHTRAVELGAVPLGQRVDTDTLRHSAARHWLASGIPINVV